MYSNKAPSIRSLTTRSVSSGSKWRSEAPLDIATAINESSNLTIGASELTSPSIAALALSIIFSLVSSPSISAKIFSELSFVIFARQVSKSSGETFCVLTSPPII